MILTDEHKSLLLSVGIHLICFLIFSGTAWHAYEQMKKGDQHIYVVGIQGGGAGKPAGAPAAAPKSGPGVPPPSAAPVKPDDLTDPALPERPLPETASPISTPFDNRQSDTVPTAEKAAGTGTSAGDGAGTEGDGQGQGGTGSGDGTGMGSGEGSGEGAGPGFDTDAIQPDVTPTFLGGSGAVYPEPGQHGPCRGPDDRGEGRQRRSCRCHLQFRVWPDGSGCTRRSLYVFVQSSL